MMDFDDQSWYCHPEPMRFAQGKLCEGSVRPSRQTLRCAQGDKYYRSCLLKIITAPYFPLLRYNRCKSTNLVRAVVGATIMVDTARFLVHFWGVRGSYPTPGPHTVRYGGNTDCVEVEVGKHTLILDAGSGIIRLGNELLRRSRAKRPIFPSSLTTVLPIPLSGSPFLLPF